MEVRILKGTNQIGGCITEITSNKGTKIIIDFGEDLVGDYNIKKQKLEINGLTNHKSKNYDAVFITHCHGDHIGLVNDINNEIDIYIEEKTKLIYNLTSDFTGKKPIIRKTKTFKFNKPILIKKDIKITPYLVDHSAFNSCMFLVEVDGKKLLHTGDYRNHGRKGKIFLETIKKIGKVDALITEGTTFSKNVTKYKTEDELFSDSIEIFQKYDDILILQSSTNVDRIVTFYKAAVKTKKNFIEDLFTGVIASNLKNIPNPVASYRNVSLFISNKYYKKTNPPYFVSKYIEPMEIYKTNVAFAKDFCMFVKPSMLNDIKMLKNKKHKLKNACIIYSMWEGYKKDLKMKRFLDELSKLGIHEEFLHTSGHADIKTMKLLEEVINPQIIIPIHTDNKEVAKEIFKNKVIDIKDKEKVII